MSHGRKFKISTPALKTMAFPSLVCVSASLSSGAVCVFKKTFPYPGQVGAQNCINLQTHLQWFVLQH